ncbi:MAG: hypothetical protein NTV22_11305 [bacterium]|nr:hypothetical protein [bacterium]
MIRPNITSYDLARRYTKYIDYSQDAATYLRATDAAIVGTTLTSAATEFTAAHVGQSLVVVGKGYATISEVTLVAPATHAHSATLDTAVGDGTALTFVVGAGAAQERDAFELMKVHMLTGYSVIVDDKLKPLIVGLRELAGKYGTTAAADPDFHALVPDDSHLFDEAHRWCCMYQFFYDQSVQGGERWAKLAGENFDRYLSHLSAAVTSFCRQLLEDGTLSDVQDTSRMTFVPLVRV